MTGSLSKSRLCAALFSVLVMTVCLAFVCDSSPHCGVLSVAGQASPAPANTTVTNNLTVAPGSITLGSTLQAHGRVSAGLKPLANASVALHMGDLKLADTRTNANGEYSFAVPVGLNYFPAALVNGATIYTVVEPNDPSFINAPSAVTAVSVDLLPFYLAIAVITAAIVTGLYLYTRRRGKAVFGPLRRGRAKPAAQRLYLYTRQRGEAAFMYTRRRGKAVFGPLRRGRAKPATEQPVTGKSWASPSEEGTLDQMQSAQEITPAADIIAEAPPQEAPKIESPLPAETSAPLAYETPRTSDTAGGIREYALRAEHLTKKFEDLTVVDDLNLAIKHREVFGFLGPNGAGKTTSIKMMVGLLQPTSGRVLFNGAEVQSMPKERIGICPQELVLWNTLTCRENLTFMGKTYRIQKPLLDERIDILLTRLSLSDQADRVASKLSGGMKRRLNIALALVHDPQIVFLDEPSAGLDPQTRQLLWDFIRSLRDEEGKTIVLTTHVMEEADALSDRIAIIDHGKLLRLDKPDNLKKTMGKGDIIELQLADHTMNGTVLQRLSALDGIEEAYTLKGRVAVRALNATSRLPDVINLIEGAGGSVSDITIRGNTLEDVFIYLTGRALRE